jgi:uncharacterized OB-fold protein
MGPSCKGCGYQSFPPRADCPECMAGEFESKEVTGKGTVHTYSNTAAAPTGFENDVPYIVVVVDTEEGGRCVGWLGDIADDDLKIDRDV